MKILELPLKKEWYNMIESGEKREEYREIKPYWSKRFVGFDAPLLSHRYGYQHANVKGYTHVRFRYGYTKRTMLYKIDEIIIERGNPYWGAPEYPVFIIKFHEMKTTKIMKVKDLIERLKEHGEDKDVYILYDQWFRVEPDQTVVVDSEELAESTCTKVGDLLILAG